VRRSAVRVMWSPRGVTADDVIRAEVQRLPLNRPVIVVTDDREIINDVRVAGANHVGSDAFIGLLER
jgi:predicted RNA-binding protein with PIN domain